MSIHKTQNEIKLLETTLSLSGGASTSSTETVEHNDGVVVSEDHAKEQRTTISSVIVSPSLLACDWANIGSEIDRCIQLGLRRFHVDVFDGVYLNSPYALTFGPQMVQAIRRHLGSDLDVELDLHICVDRPARYVTPMAEAGGTRFIFQYEVYQNNVDDALLLIRSIVDSGMKCGISINPSTPVDILYFKKEAYKNHKNNEKEIEDVWNSMFEMEKISINSLLNNLKEDKILIIHMLLRFF